MSIVTHLVALGNLPPQPKHTKRQRTSILPPTSSSPPEPPTTSVPVPSRSPPRPKEADAHFPKTFYRQISEPRARKG